jgi:hypothetical protein
MGYTTIERLEKGRLDLLTLQPLLHNLLSDLLEHKEATFIAVKLDLESFNHEIGIVVSFFLIVFGLYLIHPTPVVQSVDRA